MNVASYQGEERKVLFFTCVAHALTHAYMLIYTAILDPMRSSFGLDRDAFLGYAYIANLLFGLGALPAGWLGDRYGEKLLLVAFFVITAAGGVLLGLADDEGSLAAGMLLVGAGTSIFHPVGNAMISKCFHNSSRAMGINGLWGNVGTAAAPVLAAQIAAVADWRWAYLGLSVPTLAVGLWLAATPLGVGGRSKRTAEDAAAPAPPAAPPVETVRASPSAWKPMLVFLLFAMMCGGFYFHLITTMLPTHLEDRLSFFSSYAILGAGYVSGVVYAIGGVGQVLSGSIMHHYEGRGFYVLVLALATPLVFLVSVFSDLPLVGAACVMSIFVFAVQPIENVLLARYTPTRLRGVLFGTKFVTVFAVGGLGTWLSGYVSEVRSVAAVFVVASGFTALAMVFALVARRIG